MTYADRFTRECLLVCAFSVVYNPNSKALQIIQGASKTQKYTHMRYCQMRLCIYQNNNQGRGKTIVITTFFKQEAISKARQCLICVCCFCQTASDIFSVFSMPIPFRMRDYCLSRLQLWDHSKAASYLPPICPLSASFLPPRLALVMLHISFSTQRTRKPLALSNQNQ